MALKVFSLSPTSGTTGGTIKVTTNPHTGRVARSGSFDVSGASGSYTVSVNQSGATEFITLDQTSYTVPSTGGTITVSGTTNVEGLLIGQVPPSSQYSIGSTPVKDAKITVVDPATATDKTPAQAVAYTGTTPSGGATYATVTTKVFEHNEGKRCKYTFSFDIEVAANTLAHTKSANYVVKKTTTEAMPGTTPEATFGITLEAIGLKVSPTQIDQTADGGDADVTVTTADNWTTTNVSDNG